MEKIKERIDTIKLLGFEINTSIDDLKVTQDKVIVNTINPHSFCVSKTDLDFKNALVEGDILLPDGFGIVLAARFLNKESIKRIAGYELFLHLMSHLNQNKGSCFFLGASGDTLKLIKDKAKVEYPNVILNIYSPPYKSHFTREDNKEMFKEINKHSPDVLFVGMTAPKQEKWVNSNKDHIDSKIICSIGAVFDFYAGNVDRAPEIFIKSGLEWLHRSFKSRRLLKRNLISNPKFILEVLKARFNK